MGKFLITWQETYEMSSVVEADSLEEALAKASSLMDDTPSFEFLDEWQTGPEGGPVTMCHGETIDTECLSASGPFCVPYTEPEEEEVEEISEDDPDVLAEIPWPSEEDDGTYGAN
jgi:hypothetical protein